MEKFFAFITNIEMTQYVIVKIYILFLMLVVSMNLQWLAMLFPERSQVHITMLLMKQCYNNEKLKVKCKTDTEMVFISQFFLCPSCAHCGRKCL